MKISRKYIYLCAAILLFIGAGLYFYWKLEPSQHFRNTDIPVLATPDQNMNTESPIPTPPAQDTSNKTDADKEQSSFNILLLGTDARDNEASRTDVIILAHVNPTKKTINLISIPRDTRVNLPGIGYTKINHAHVLSELKGGEHSGTEASIQAVSNLCSTTINYYVKTNFAGFEHFIDTIGGLDIHLDETVKFTYVDMILEAGDHHLNGTETLNLVRERKSLSEGDTGRQANQALVLKTLAYTLLQPKNLKNLPSLISQVKEDILDTNLSDSDMISLAWMVQGITEDQFQYTQFPGQSGKEFDPVVKTKLYYWMPDMETWANESQKLLGD
ncbi:LCP family protein [Paenibacillus segetis]|uniref:Cell envelope-related transcriptional attenuator domain-containing protein n=1 Tax=Paenibacillus segetis TaxID=1325360 RepID=A0ABQ1YN07_9BACL|nr:LCP family protein [Paenibacillus segetis]GGH32240.1 hypothetical protein GCM10008013_36520 [Paenibacillus segetis]